MDGGFKPRFLRRLARCAMLSVLLMLIIWWLMGVNLSYGAAP